jgi:hypothetical protein
VVYPVVSEEYSISYDRIFSQPTLLTALCNSLYWKLSSYPCFLDSNDMTRWLCRMPTQTVRQFSARQTAFAMTGRTGITNLPPTIMTSGWFHAQDALSPGRNPGTNWSALLCAPEPVWMLWRIGNLMLPPTIEVRFVGFPARNIGTIPLMPH